MSLRSLSRRQALGSVGMIAAGSAASWQVAAQQDKPPSVGSSSRSGPRLAPRAELVNVLEYEAQARLALAPSVYARIAGGDRAAFDRITLRPRMLVPTTSMDLGSTLLGAAMAAPILVAPIADQQAFHPDAEAATARGASAAKAALIVSSRASVPIETVVTATTSPVWFQVFARDPAAGAQIQAAEKAGCAVICVTPGAPPTTSAPRAGAMVGPRDWDSFATLRRRVTLPLLVKGIVTPEAAKQALQQRADGIVVSTYGAPAGAGPASPILLLPAIVDAIGGTVPVLVDGGFSRGTDILKALAFGAKGVLVGRPVMWGLAAYGSDGVQGVLEMLQTELARYMAMCGKPTLGVLDRSLLTVHAARPAAPDREHRRG